MTMLDPTTIERMEAAGEGAILVALSGGGDSVALLHLLAERFGAERLRAVVVDHALRATSGDEALEAADIARALRVEPHILTLTWPHGPRRAQQAARRARYAALCNYARSVGAQLIAIAHHADDQAETMLMRARAGSTWRGLAGMAPMAFAPVWPEGRGIVLARPLLGVRRAALREYLRERGASWIEDPSNEDEAFERVRTRKRVAELEANGLDVMRLVRTSIALRTHAEHIDREAYTLIERAAVYEDWSIGIRREAWSGPQEVRCRALAVLIAAASGADREPSISRMAELEGRVMSTDHRGSTHSGVHFVPRSEGVFLTRENAAFMGRGERRPREPIYVVLDPGVETVWDGRFAITAFDPGWRLHRSGERFAFDRRTYEPGLRDPAVRQLARERVAHALGIGLPR